MGVGPRDWGLGTGDWEEGKEWKGEREGRVKGKEGGRTGIRRGAALASSEPRERLVMLCE